jgi:hypothetical protein
MRLLSVAALDFAVVTPSWRATVNAMLTVRGAFLVVIGTVQLAVPEINEVLEKLSGHQPFSRGGCHRKSTA